jgi:hypothetical protein
MIYIKARLQEIKRILDNDNDNISDNQTESSSIPISRNYINENIDLNKKVTQWINKCKLK